MSAINDDANDENQTVGEFETLKVEIVEEWAEVTVNRPDKLNAINLQVVRDLHAAVDMLAQRDDIRGMIITGAGDRAFVAGADISELVERTREDALAAINAGLFQKIEDFPWPTIAVIRGFALGGGCELALSCDMRLGGESARLGQPELRLGIIPGAGAPHRLTRVVGPGRARELIFTGRIIEADEAFGMGLLNHVHADDAVLAEARTTMRQIMKMSPMALRIAKLALNAAVNTVDRRSAMVEVLGQGMLFESDDKHARMTKFLERKNAKEQKK